MLTEMKSLVDKLLTASAAYYSGQETLMSDKEYDDLSAKLEALEAATGLTLPNSPSVNVGHGMSDVATTTPFEKVTHEYPSLSLDKTKSLDELTEWMDDNVCVLSWKLDGLTIVLTYDDGKLIRAATRGTGKIGEDVTRNVVNFENVPLTIPDRRHIVIRGEAVMSYRAFEKVNESLPPHAKRYSTPLRAAAAATKTLDPKKTAHFGVRFIPFDLMNAGKLGFRKMSQAFGFIDELGLEPVYWTLVDKNSVVKTIKEREERVIGKTLLYPTDGLVLHYNDLDICAQLGATQKFPRYAKAFKWNDETKSTIVRDIEWSVSKTGYVTPIAIFDPVELNGTTVKRANLHSVKIARELELGIGDRVTVYKANMIVPKIHENLDRSGLDIPGVCPVCGNKLEREVNLETGEIVALRCVISDCGSRG